MTALQSGVQLSLDFGRPIATRPAKARALAGTPPWKDRPATAPERAPSPLWVLPAPALTEADVAEGVWRAVHDTSGRLRFPAGADAVALTAAQAPAGG